MSHHRQRKKFRQLERSQNRRGLTAFNVAYLDVLGEYAQMAKERRSINPKAKTSFGWDPRSPHPLEGNDKHTLNRWEFWFQVKKVFDEDTL